MDSPGQWSHMHVCNFLYSDDKRKVYMCLHILDSSGKFLAEDKSPSATLLFEDPWRLATPFVPIQLAKGKLAFSGMNFHQSSPYHKQMLHLFSKKKLKVVNHSPSFQDTMCMTAMSGWSSAQTTYSKSGLKCLEGLMAKFSSVQILVPVGLGICTGLQEGSNGVTQTRNRSDASL